MRAKSRVHRATVVAALSFTFLPGGLAAQGPGRGAAGPRPQPAPPLSFEYLGPESAGRFAAIAGIPGDTATFFLGAASGGVWKTTDGGSTFEPTFDDQDAQAIGALAVAPSDPDIVWAGTGEAWAIRDADVMGNGIYRSTDGGESWTNMGLEKTGRIGRIIVHPTNPDIVYACALGRTTGPQEERGVFRTNDGGATWKRVLFVNEDTGCSGLDMDANDPNVLFAGTWEVVMHTWAMFSGGEGSGVWVTRDAGDHWSRLEAGLPDAPVGKVDVAVAPSDSRRVYALIQTADQGSVWRSDDGGRNWGVVSWDRTLIGRAGYYIRIEVNPANADEVLVANSSFHRSTDGGRTFPLNDRGCGDCHDIWMDPTDPDRWGVTGDGGAAFTYDHGDSFNRYRLPIGQMYHVAIDDRVPYWVYSNRQDDGTMRGPVDSPIRVDNVPSYQPERGGGRFGFAPSTPWQPGLGGCESGFTLPLHDNPHIVWASCYGNTVTRFDDRVGVARSVAPWIHTLDSPPTDTKYRCHWTPPLAIDPFDEETVYYGCQVVFMTSDKGQSWKVISPDLSTQDPDRIAFSGGIIGDNLGQFYGEVVFAIAPSKIQRGLIWAGTNDGKLWYTKDKGGSWTDVTANVGMPEWGTIRKIQPSAFDSATAYVAVDYHMMDGFDPYIYKTTDFGQTWTRVDGDLPRGGPLDYVMAVTENPNRPGMLFAGTGKGFYWSKDDGAHWTRLRNGLPAAPVTWVVVDPRYHDVVVSTYGRGLFVLRDITRLEQTDQVAAGAAVQLYEPPTVFRQARSGSASFLYGVAAGKVGPARLEILTAAGNPVRTMELRAVEGLNRATWDLLYDGPAQPELRTTPPDNPNIWEEPRFEGRDTRPIVHWGIQGPQNRGPIAAPGVYTARLTLGDQVAEQPFEVVKDPYLEAPVADLEASTATQLRIRNDLNRTVDLVNRLEIMRKQIQDQMSAHAGDRSLTGPLSDLDEELMDVELNLITRTEMHSDDKWYVEAYGVYLNLVWLSGEVGLGAGDVAGGADHRPTNASLEVLDMIEQKLRATEHDFQQALEGAVADFNRRMSGKLEPITDPGATNAVS